MQEPRELDRAVGIRELGADRRRQVLDVGDLDQPRLGRALHPDRELAEATLDSLDDDPVLGAVLVAVQQSLAEVVVDRRVGAAPGGPREGNGRGPGPVSPHEQLGAGAEKGCLRGSATEAEARREQLAQRREDRRRVVGGVALHPDLASEDDLLELPRPRSGQRCRPPALRSGPGSAAPRSGSHRWGADRRARSRAPIRAASRPARWPPRAPHRARASPANTAFAVRKQRSPLRKNETSGRTSSAGGSEDHWASAPPSGAKAKPPVSSGPAPGGASSGASIAARPSSRRHPRRDR